MDLEVIESWAHAYPWANIGAVTGRASGVFVLDVDPRNGGYDTLNNLETEYGSLPPTLTLVTGGGGTHYYFKHPGFDVRNSSGQLGPGLDIKGENGFVVAPNSRHVSGKLYRWRDGRSPADVSLSDAPDWLLELIRPKPRMELVKSPTASSGVPPPWKGRVPEGQRNPTLMSVAGSLRNLGLGEKQIEPMLQAFNRDFCSPPLDAEEVRKIAWNVIRYDPWLNSRTLELTDSGNAERFVELHRDKVRYITESREWRVFDSTRWVCNTALVFRMAKESVRSIRTESMYASPEMRSQLLEHAKRSESRRSLEAMMALAAHEEAVAVRQNDLDSDPWLLNCLNGTLDLRTGKLQPHNPRDLLTKMAGAAYLADADCPRFLAFLCCITGNSKKLLRYLQRLVGYALTGSVEEQCLVFFYGGGANGKSTLAEILLALLGDYAIKTSTDFLLQKRFSGNSNEVARLKGARLVVPGEIPLGAYLDEARIKELTGGDRLSARFLYQEFFEFQPTHKLWVYGNHKPIILGVDRGIWRRIHLIHLPIEIPEAERDPKLLQKLKEELPGILRWAVEGCLEWQKTGLDAPESVREAVQGYREDMDPIGEFIEACCTVAPTGFVSGTDLYNRYVDWCRRGNEEPLNKRVFSQQIESKGFRQHRTSAARGWSGIMVKE